MFPGKALGWEKEEPGAALVAMAGRVEVELWASSIDYVKGQSSYVSVVRVCCISRLGLELRTLVRSRRHEVALSFQARGSLGNDPPKN